MDFLRAPNGLVNVQVERNKCFGRISDWDKHAAECNEQLAPNEQFAYLQGRGVGNLALISKSGYNASTISTSSSTATAALTSSMCWLKNGVVPIS